MLSHRNRGSAGLLTIMLATVLALVAVAPVAARNPAGNNGTVKIDRLAFDDHPNNQPHAHCTFQVDFYGFDAGPTHFARVIFELQAPTQAGRTMTVTSGNQTPFIGEDDNSGGASEAGLDASETYTLAFTGDAHPGQGYHVKLTVHAPGSQGADTKHKVFWVLGCNRLDPPGRNPPGNPPDGGVAPGAPAPSRGDTAGGNPPVTVLPDTSAADAGLPLSLLAGTVLLGGSVTLVAVEVRRRASRR